MLQTMHYNKTDLYIQYDALYSKHLTPVFIFNHQYVLYAIYDNNTKSIYRLVGDDGVVCSKTIIKIRLISSV